MRTIQQGVQPFNISESLGMPTVVDITAPSLPTSSHPAVPPAVSTDEQQRLEIQIDCEMDISPLRPEAEYSPLISMVSPVASAVVASKENTPSHPAAKRMKVEEVVLSVPAPPTLLVQGKAKVKPQTVKSQPVPALPPVPEPVQVPCAEQIDTSLRHLVSVVTPLAALLDELSPGPKTTPATSSAESDARDGPSQHSSLTASVAPGGVAPSAARARTTKPAADDDMQTKKLAHIQRVLFPSHLFTEKPAEISQTGVVLHIVEETLR